MRRARKPLARRVGDTRVLSLGGHHFSLRDPYHLVLTLSWPQFFAALVTIFLATNLIFGALYYLEPGSVANARPGVFFDHFFFSIETLATVGYGAMSPATTYGHIVASLEILCGMVGLAVVTGLVFARFSKPTARILFSERAVVRQYDGQRVLMLRVANERLNRIAEATASLTLVRTESTAGGETFIRMHDLPLLRKTSPVFALTWMLVHPIDESSPLHGWSAEQLAAARARIMVSVVGHDLTMATSVYAGYDYQAEDLAFAARFVDILQVAPDGERQVDLTRFHEIEPEVGAAPAAMP